MVNSVVITFVFRFLWMRLHVCVVLVLFGVFSG